MTEIYFDNSATTKISKRAREKMLEVMDSRFGNPSSLHKLGLDAEHVVSDARRAVLEAMGITRFQNTELVFTSGGTESNNLAIFGTVFAKKRRGGEKILTTSGEHSSVEEPLSYLEGIGYKVLRIPTPNGKLDLDFVRENAKDVILCTLMHVNNETGALYDVKEAFSIVREASAEAVCHVDATQSFMKVRLSPKSLGADLISISAHKINGAKGTGALYISPQIIKAKKLVPTLLGGGQEQNIRSGTENVYGISAFGEAIREHFESLDSEIKYLEELKAYIIQGASELDGVRVNLPQCSAPHIISITVKGIRSETMLHFLSSKNIYVSSGSACSSHAKNKKSGALESFGLSASEADCTIRVSLSRDNTKDEAELLLKALEEASKRLARR